MNKEKVNIFLRAMSMENSLLQSYRALFLALEAALIAAGFALIRLSEGKSIVGVGIAGLVIGIAGLVISVMWIIVCHAKGNDVDKWRDRLLEVTKEGDIQGYFSYVKSGFSLAGGRVARYWFNWIMPVLIILLWIWVIFIR